MTKKNVWILPIIILVTMLIAFFIKYEISEGNREFITEKEYFQAEGDNIAILYNFNLQSASGIYRNGEAYLPLNWVNAILNDKFFWNEEEELLIYTLPDNILYCDFNTLGSSGNPLLYKEGDKVYIALSIVSTYTDILSGEFLDTETKRIFITDKISTYIEGFTKKKVHIRKEADLDSPILTNMEAGIALELVLDDVSLEALQDKDVQWVKVYTPTGFTGYVEKKKLKGFVVKEKVSLYQAPEYTVNHPFEKIILGWHQVTVPNANNNLSDMIANTSGMNVISPTWFSLSDNAGNYTSLASKEYVEKAHSKGIQVWPLIDNFSDAVDMNTLLSSTEARKTLISQLIADAKAYGFDGINIDFETLKQSNIKYFIQFLRELSVHCRKNNLVLSVDNPAYVSFNGYYERGKQAEVVDYIINMGYDEHYAGSDMGSVASYNYVKESIERSLVEVPKDKFINAMPLYTRLWTTSGSETTSKAVGIKAAKAWVEENKVNLTWNEELGQYIGNVVTADGTVYIWMEEEKSLGVKVNLAKENDIGGLAVWKLGLEPEEIWSVITLQ